MKTGEYYGIDFGTTNTSVYYYHYDAQGQGALEAKYGTDGKDLNPFRSCIAIPKSEQNPMRFGDDVKKNRNKYAEEYTIVTSFKSWLGTGKELRVGRKTYTGKVLTTLFLQHVKETVQAEQPNFQEAIFSIPVDFSEKARTELMEAAEAVGIRVKGFVTESSAACISKVQDLKACSRIMVIDFGGGTLDLSVLQLKHKQNHREVEVHEEAVYGILFGGDDIDQELAQRIFPKLYPETSFEALESKQKDKLMNEVEQMKIEFAEADDYTIILGNNTKPLDIDYDTFSEIVTPLITDKVLPAILKAMDQASVGAESIDAVILAGGSSGLRPFADKVLSLFGAEKILFDEGNYQWMVAKGAAITSACDCEFRLSDDICVLLSDGELYPILKKGDNKVGDTSAPISFSLTEDAQDAHFIFTDSEEKHRYKTISVDAKGYIDEKFELSVSLCKDQVAYIVIKNPSIGAEYRKEEKIHQLRFYYNLTGIEGGDV